MFSKMFLVSGIARQFEIGNPTYVVGMNGCEVARIVCEKCGYEIPGIPDEMYIDKSEEYWIGWAISYYQWNLGTSFKRLFECVPIIEFYKMYPTYHEMDIETLVEVLDERCINAHKESQLKRLRAYAQLSQRALSVKTGVPLRQIQLFEQGQRDISKTQGNTLFQLAKGLNCKMEDLVGL